MKPTRLDLLDGATVEEVLLVNQRTLHLPCDAQLECQGIGIQDLRPGCTKCESAPERVRRASSSG